MSSTYEISENLYYVGANDPELRVFDIIMYTPYGTSYNAYLIIGKEKTCLVETVKEKFYDQMLEKIEAVIGKDGKIDYILHNHTEPDHSGSSIRLVTEKYPDATVVGSRTAIKYLKQIGNEKMDNVKTIETEEIKSLDLGDITLQFYAAPFLHWPDTIFTYSPELKALFPCDFFGSHFAIPGEEVVDSKIPAEMKEGYDEAFKYYYDCIFGPFKKFSLDGIEIYRNLLADGGVDHICCSHGPVLDTINETFSNTYQEWSEGYDQQIDDNKITIAYVSAYGYTGEMAELIAEGIREAGGPDCVVKMFDVTYEDESEIAAELMTSKGILFGTSTILGDALPTVYGLTLKYVNPILSQGQIGGAFGSYGWSGEGAGNIHQRLEQTKITLPLDPLRVNFRAGEKDGEACLQWGRDFGKAIFGTGQNESQADDGDGQHYWKCSVCGFIDEAVDPAEQCEVCGAVGDIWTDEGVIIEAPPKASDQVNEWKCTVCAHIETGDSPPEECPLCGAVGDVWEGQASQDDEAALPTGPPYTGKVGIIGGGPAGLSCAKQLRRIASDKAEIILFSEEGLPYNRTQLTKQFEISPIEPESFYTGNNIDLIEQRVVSASKNENDGKFELVTLDDTSFLGFDDIVLSVGSKALNPFGEFDNLFTVHHQSDMEQILSNKPLGDVVVIGGGVLGMEMLDFLYENEESFGWNSLSIIEMQSQLLNLYFNEEPIPARMITSELESKSIDVYTSTGVKELISKGNEVDSILLENVLTENEFSIDNVDTVILAISITPNLELSEMLGCDFDPRGGVHVNDSLETSIDGVYAIGDSAFLNMLYPRNWIGATNMGQVAAQSIIDSPIGSVVDDYSSHYVMDMFGFEVIQSGIRSDEIDMVTMMVDPEENYFVRFGMESDEKVMNILTVGEKGLFSSGLIKDSFGKQMVDVLRNFVKVIPK